MITMILCICLIFIDYRYSKNKKYINDYDLYSKFSLNENDRTQFSDGTASENFIDNLLLSSTLGSDSSSPQQLITSNSFNSNEVENIYSNSNKNFNNRQNEEKNPLTTDDIDVINPEQLDSNFEENADDCSSMNSNEKVILKEQHKELIKEIDNLFKHYPTKNILADVIPWKYPYEENKLNSEWLNINNIAPTNISCIPYRYGYTDQLAKKLFKEKTYNDCRSNSLISKANEDAVTINCRSFGEYLLGGKENNQILGDYLYNSRWQPAISNTIMLKNNEFIIVKCQEVIKQAYRINRFSTEASNRSKNITEKISSFLNLSTKRSFSMYIYLSLRFSIKKTFL